MSASRRIPWVYEGDQEGGLLFQGHVDDPEDRKELTRRETQILELLVGDLTDKEIARTLGITHRTVRTHLERIYRKQRVRSRTGAVAAWLMNLPRS